MITVDHEQDISTTGTYARVHAKLSNLQFIYCV